MREFASQSEDARKDPNGAKIAECQSIGLQGSTPVLNHVTALVLEIPLIVEKLEFGAISQSNRICNPENNSYTVHSRG